MNSQTCVTHIFAPHFNFVTSESVEFGHVFGILGTTEWQRFGGLKTFVMVPGSTTKKSPWIGLEENVPEHLEVCHSASALEKYLSRLPFGVGGSTRGAKWPQWSHYIRRVTVPRLSDAHKTSYSALNTFAPIKSHASIYIWFLSLLGHFVIYIPWIWLYAIFIWPFVTNTRDINCWGLLFYTPRNLQRKYCKCNTEIVALFTLTSNFVPGCRGPLNGFYFMFRLKETITISTLWWNPVFHQIVKHDDWKNLET